MENTGKCGGLNLQSKNLRTEVCQPATTVGMFTIKPLCTINAKLVATMLSKVYLSVDPSKIVHILKGLSSQL